MNDQAQDGSSCRVSKRGCVTTIGGSVTVSTVVSLRHLKGYIGEEGVYSNQREGEMEGWKV
jgi:hypothetical protein